MVPRVSSRRVPLLGAFLLVVLVATTVGSALPPGQQTVAIPLAVAPTHGPRTQGHIDTPTSDLYIAESLTSARWSTGAVKERFLGRPFWVEPLTGAGVRVAIIDTGVDPDHPDLAGQVVAWRDFLFQRAAPYDDDTHGTHVAGIVAAKGHFQYRPDMHYFPFGARGVAPGVQLIVAKAMDTNGDGDARHVAQAIRWALDPNGDGDYSDGAHVINLSIGLEVPPQPDGDRPVVGPITIPAFPSESGPDAQVVREAIQHAVRAGAIVVVAAGNHEPGAKDHQVTFPGTMKEVITVGAVDSDGRPAAFSNTGAPGSGKPDLVAPGVLLSTFPHARDLEDARVDGYVALGGTSMAAPMVAGTVALMLEGDPSLRRLSATEDLSWHTHAIRSILLETAEGTGHTPQTGYGTLRVDAAASRLDRGGGPVNWDALGVLLLVVLLVAGLVALRRRRTAQALRVRQAKAEARARLDAREGPVPVDDGTPRAADDTALRSGRAAPAWQRAPWESDDPQE